MNDCNNSEEDALDSMSAIVMFGALTTIFEHYGIDMFSLNMPTTLCPASIYALENPSSSCYIKYGDYFNIFFPPYISDIEYRVDCMNRNELKDLADAIPRKDQNIRTPYSGHAYNYWLSDTGHRYYSEQHPKRSGAYGYYTFPRGLGGKEVNGIYKHKNGIWKKAIRWGSPADVYRTIQHGLSAGENSI